jgi:cytochrome c peroxidase
MNKLYANQQTRWLSIISIVFLCLMAVGLWHSSELLEKPKTNTEAKSVAIMLNSSAIEPIPLKIALNEQKVDLGQKLFNEPKLSADNTIACVKCHSLDTGGTDRLALSRGINNTLGIINTPTVFNSGLNFRMHWNGVVKTLEEQIDKPIHSERVMASNWPDIINKLKQSPEYTSMFNQIYNDDINSDNIKDAIATFERSLYTPNSRFDKFLRGDKNALTPEEKEGYSRFRAYGCVSCHQGINIGGNLFQTFGLFGNYFEDRGNVTEADWGRFKVTKNESDRYMFRVPSLRNVALTKPYFHDGTAETLEEAVTIMGKYQLGRQLSEQDVELIVKFLKTLTGEYQGKPL